jgi:hypothetical protein
MNPSNVCAEPLWTDEELENAWLSVSTANLEEAGLLAILDDYGAQNEI